jgi:acetyltransferase-like isoleucine patch superfamily enzyme
MLQQIHPTPWKVVNEVRRYLTLPYTRLNFALNGVAWGSRWRVYGTPIIQRHRGSTIEIGEGWHVRSWRSTNPLGVVHPIILATWTADARIEIGDEVAMTGTAVVAQTHVHIGHRCRIGANVTIADTDFHPLESEDRNLDPRAGVSREVIIEDDVFIGMWALILKGTHIGRGSVIGAGSVVTGKVEPGTIVAGNPIHAIRNLSSYSPA